MPVITGIIKCQPEHPEYHQLQRNNAFQGIFIINVGIQTAVIYIINHGNELIHQKACGNQKNQELYLVPQLSRKKCQLSVRLPFSLPENPAHKQENCSSSQCKTKAAHLIPCFLHILYNLVQPVSAVIIAIAISIKGNRIKLRFINSGYCNPGLAIFFIHGEILIAGHKPAAVITVLAVPVNVQILSILLYSDLLSVKIKEEIVSVRQFAFFPIQRHAVCIAVECFIIIHNRIQKVLAFLQHFMGFVRRRFVIRRLSLWLTSFSRLRLQFIRTLFHS